MYKKKKHFKNQIKGKLNELKYTCIDKEDIRNTKENEQVGKS